MPEAEAPVVWGDFEVRFDRLLGRGGMGSVYEARQISLDRTVAVKVLDTDRAPTDDLAEGFLEKFQHEARALARLNDPRIVTILQAGRADGKCWYAMELVDGRTLDQRISDAGAFDPREAARVAADVARALSAALAQGILHRDVKPANIFLTADGRVKLGDFGLSRSGEGKPTRFTEMNAVAGTPEYASPEQAANGTCDHRSDQYSLGAVLFEMVTERPPFGGANALETYFKHAHELPPLPTRLNPDLPPALEAVILRCLEKDPARRYPDYETLIRDLERIRVDAPVAPPDAPARAERPTLALRTAWVAGAALAGFSIWGGFKIFPKGPEPPRRDPAPVAHEESTPAPPAPPVPPAADASPEKEEPPKRESSPAELEKAARDAAWAACDRGDEGALAGYLATRSDPVLENELAGIRDPFAHPATAAFQRAIRGVYAGRAFVPEPLGEIRSWRVHPEMLEGTWKKSANGLDLQSKGELWVARECPVDRGFSVAVRFSPEGSHSWAAVALSEMSEKSFHILHVLQAGSGLVASVVDRRARAATGIGETETGPGDRHEFAVIPCDGKFACFVDGGFVGWHEGAGPGGRLSIGVKRGGLEVTEIRIAR